MRDFQSLLVAARGNVISRHLGKKGNENVSLVKLGRADAGVCCFHGPPRSAKDIELPRRIKIRVV